jgi:hypothetical protein
MVCGTSRGGKVAVPGGTINKLVHAGPAASPMLTKVSPLAPDPGMCLSLSHA